MTPLTDQTQERITLRLPSSLHERLTANADEADRSLNGLIVEVLAAHFDKADRQALWPAGTGGRATFRAEVRWSMPHFDPLTEDRIDIALTEVTRVLREWGADDLVTVNGPELVQPLAMRKLVSHPDVG